MMIWDRLSKTVLFLGGSLTSAAADTPQFSLPLDCTIGKTCFVQNFVDMDPGGQKRDPFCGAATYDGHKGTDFRVRDIAEMRIGIPVLAMADGKVIGIRNTAADKLVESEKARRAVKDRECGNGLAIDHGGGWVTQMCHMARGSVGVKPGDVVKRGQPVGRIGLSGFTAFPHVHVSVRKNDRIVDPMTAREPGASCEEPGPGLWTASAEMQIGRISTALLQAGYTNGPVTGAELMKNLVGKATDAGPLVFYATFINLQAGDRVELEVSTQQGIFARSRTEPLAAPKATYTAFAGKKGAVPKGLTFTGIARLLRNGKVLAERRGIEIVF